jgi:hypothetical protein
MKKVLATWVLFLKVRCHNKGALDQFAECLVQA